MADEPLTPIEEALVRALTRAIVKELREDAVKIAMLRQLDEAVAHADKRNAPKRKRTGRRRQ